MNEGVPLKEHFEALRAADQRALDLALAAQERALTLALTASGSRSGGMRDLGAGIVAVLAVIVAALAYFK